MALTFPMLMPEFSYQGIFPRASWRTAYLLGCNESKVRSRHSNQWPDDCTFFPVVICNLIKEPAEKHSDKPAKTIRAHGTPQTLQPMAKQLYLFFVVIWSRNLPKQSKLMEPPNIPTNGQTTVPYFPVIIWLTNPPKHGTPQTYLSHQTYIYSLLLLFPNKCE